MIELMQPEFNPEGLKQKPIYRFNQHGKRYYFTIDDGNATFYPSVTTLIADAIPEGYALKNLRMELGREYNEFMRKKARHGTFMHIAFADYLKTKEIDLEHYKQLYTQFMFDAGFEVNFFEANDFAKHLLSLIQWSIEYQVKPLLIEQVVTYNDGKYKFAGALDLYCEMKFNKKFVRAVVDVKSGAYAGFFREHEIQLLMYKMAFQQTFNENVDLIANLSPKNWKRRPNYDFKNQTESKYNGAVRSILELAYILGNYDDPDPILEIKGKITDDTDSAYEFIPATEYVLKLDKVNN